MTMLILEPGTALLPWTLGFDDENVDREWALEQSPMFAASGDDGCVVYTCRISNDCVVMVERCYERDDLFWISAYHRTTARWRSDDCIVASPLEAMAVIHEWNKGNKTPQRYGPEI